jgi:hypothetical protein
MSAVSAAVLPDQVVWEAQQDITAVVLVALQFLQQAAAAVAAVAGPLIYA